MLDDNDFLERYHETQEYIRTKSWTDVYRAAAGGNAET